MHAGLIVGALPRFIDLLRARLAAGVHTTEDSVRYLLFASLLERDADPNRIVQEYPHPVESRARIDTVLLDAAGQPTDAVEFKYDRAGPGGHNQPRSQKAGAALADLRRLHDLPYEGRWFVHLLDREMARYMSSPSNGLARVWGAAADASVTIGPSNLSRLSKTLRVRAGEWMEDIVVQVAALEHLAENHQLRVLQLD